MNRPAYWSANASRKGLREAFGLMVNLPPRPARLARNYELFAQIMRDRASQADAPIENYKVGDFARYGIGYADL